MATFPPPAPLEIQLRHLHEELRLQFPDIARVAVAVYDAKTDALRTLSSSDEGPGLKNHQAKLSQVPSLQQLAQNHRDRVVDDLSVFAESDTVHSQVIVSRFRSSYTRPLVDGDRLRGFAFFDSTEKGYFTPYIVARLAIFAELIAVLLTRSLIPSHVLKSAVAAASEISHQRDPETGAHLDRMSRFSLAIASRLADDDEALSDEILHNILLLSPLHDIGKIAIPDAILLKPGRLSAGEMDIMKTHTTKGVELVDRLVERLSLAPLRQAQLLHNIVLYHHERYDGTGYPVGLSGAEIPFEARIVTAADVFDALTSVRSYKPAWSNDEALAYMIEQRESHFDPGIVDVLAACMEEIAAIQARFVDPPDATRFREGYGPEL